MFKGRVGHGLTRLVVVCAFLSVAPSTFAGGYEVGENSPIAMGRGGAYVARVNEPSALYFNPAGLSRTEGFDLNFNVNLLFTYNSFDRDTYVFPDESGRAIRYRKIINDQSLLPSPMLFASHDFGLENVSFGAGFYAPPAVPAKRFPLMSEDAANPTSSNPVVSRAESNAYQVADMDVFAVYPSIGFGAEIPKANLRIGLTLQAAWVMTRVTAGIDGAGFTTGDSRLIGEDAPNGYFAEENANLYSPAEIDTAGVTATGIFGLQYDPIPQLTFGFTYRPQHKVPTDGTVTLKLSEQLDSLVTLNGEDASLDVYFPHVLRFGVDYKHLDDTGFELFDLELNVVHERWSVVDRFNANVDATVSDSTGLLTDFDLPIIEVPFEFDNTLSFRLGSDLNFLRNRETGDGLTLRLGAFYETAASPDEYTQLFFTSFERISVSTGASIHIGKWAVDLGAMFIHSPTRTVDNGEFRTITPLWICNDPPEGNQNVANDCAANESGDQPGQAANNGEYKANYLVLSAGFTYGW